MLKQLQTLLKQVERLRGKKRIKPSGNFRNEKYNDQNKIKKFFKNFTGQASKNGDDRKNQYTWRYVNRKFPI